MPRGFHDLTYLLLVLGIVACGDQGQEKVAIDPVQDVAVVFETQEPYSPKRLSQEEIEGFLQENSAGFEDSLAIHQFYDRRDRQYAWFVNDSLSESAISFMALINSNDTLHRAVAALRDEIDSLLHADRRDRLAWLELSLTAKFFKFAGKRYGGLISGDLQELEWYIPRRKKNYDRLLDSLVAGRMDLSSIEPVHEQYFLLKEFLKDLSDLEKEPWEPLEMDRRKIEPGDRAEVVPAIRERLRLLGDLIATSDSLTDPELYDTLMVAAVKEFQLRHGTIADGVIGPKVLASINVPPADRMRTLLINMERLRWLPQEMPEDLLLVNIPEFKLHVYEAGRIRQSHQVVVGKAASRTVIFSDTITYIVFDPYWNIPKSIVRNEILPAVKKDERYLEKKNMERYGGTDAEPLIRQLPGPTNSLGRVKFMFPNTYHIYLHDTPAKNLFHRDQRAFSHGCIRVSDALGLAEYLLRNDTAWSAERIQKVLDKGVETEVGLKRPRPVMIVYFTAWVDGMGRLNFRDDIYGHDAKLAAELFGESEGSPTIATSEE